MIISVPGNTVFFKQNRHPYDRMSEHADSKYRVPGIPGTTGLFNRREVYLVSVFYKEGGHRQRDHKSEPQSRQQLTCEDSVPIKNNEQNCYRRKEEA